MGRNCQKLGYPFKESLLSLLPLVDELVVVLDPGEDDTWQMVEAIADPKIKLIESRWDMSLRTGGHLLAVETNKALAAINPQATWAIYLQADEVLHEQDYAALRALMQQHATSPQVESILLNYHHFWASYHTLADGTNWYRREIRIIKNTGQVSSYKDAQGFRHSSGRKLRAVLSAGYVFHYGWVKPPEIQKAKEKTFNKLWHDDAWMDTHVADTPAYDYQNIESVAPFTGTHPHVMAGRVAAMPSPFKLARPKPMKLKERFKRFCRRYFGYIPGEYRNYRV